MAGIPLGEDVGGGSSLNTRRVSDEEHAEAIRDELGVEPDGPEDEIITPESAWPADESVAPKSVIVFDGLIFLSTEEPKQLRDRLKVVRREDREWVRVSVERPVEDGMFRTVDMHIRPNSITAIGEA